MAEIIGNSQPESGLSPEGQAAIKNRVNRAAVLFASLLVSTGVGVVVLGTANKSPKRTGEQLEHILKPPAIQMGAQILGVNETRGYIVTKKDGYDDGGETVSAQGWVIGEAPQDDYMVNMSATMFRDQDGQLDPSTTEEVNIQISGCHVKSCGTSHNTYQNIDITDPSFSAGEWELVDQFTPQNYEKPTITIDTHGSGVDAETSLREAAIWAKYASSFVDEALGNGDITLPKLHKPS